MTQPSDLFVEFEGQGYPMTLAGSPQDTGYVIRLSPFTGYHNQCAISTLRAKRQPGVNIDLDITPVDSCRFCNYESETPMMLNIEK
ncbi:hypothetical protein ACFLQN_00320 [Candidatus Aenigmatarchaeota archaeon]